MARKASNKRRKAITGGGSPSGISPAAELISGNVDLLTEIFLRLPAKSLIRFKSVSKHWLSLISHPQFSAKHSSRNPRPSISGLYFYHRSSLESLSLHGRKNLPSIPFVDGPEGTGSIPRIRNSCNGLLLCEIGSFKVHLRLYVVFNPTTQKYKVLPKSSRLSFRSYLRRDAYLAFDPSKSPHYKVVVGSRYNRSRDEPWCFEIDMYDSDSGNWKKILPPDTCCGRGVFHNGAIHWLSYKNVLLRFEVDAEKMIALPIPGCRRRSIEYFGECGDCLILIQARSFRSMELKILKLESDTCDWIARYWVNLETIGSAFPEMEALFKFCVLCVVKGEMKEDYALVLAIPEKVISYNLKCNKLDVLRVQGELTDDYVAAYAAYSHPLLKLYLLFEQNPTCGTRCAFGRTFQLVANFLVLKG